MYRWAYIHMHRFGVSEEEQCCKHCGINVSINEWREKCFRKGLRRIDWFWSSAKFVLLETKHCLCIQKYKGDGYWINVIRNGFMFFWMSFSTCRNSSKFHEIIVHFRFLWKVGAAVKLVIFFFCSTAQGWMNLRETHSMPKPLVKIIKHGFWYIFLCTAISNFVRCRSECT